MSKNRYVKSLAVACAALGWAAAGSAADWSVVKESSSVGFVGVQQGTRFSGRFESFEAQISLDPQEPTSGSIVGTVETGSVNSRDHDRDAALLDTDWFDSGQYPQARFESESIERAEDGTYKAAGQLTLKGTSKPAVMTFTLDVNETSSAQPNAGHFSGKMTVNRFDFNVGEGWNDTSWVAQNVDVQVELDLTR